MNSTPEISYTPFKSPTEIRLLSLKPGPIGSPIECTLIHSHIQGQEYEALSYEWGKQKLDEATIMLSGSTRKIRKNLHNALSRIRDSETDKARVLWIDFLCINQADNKE